MEKKVVYISFLGIDQRSRSAYEIFFKTLSQYEWVLTDDYHQAQICLIDKDAYRFQQDYQSLQTKHPRLIYLILSLTDYQCQLDTEIFIRKPVQRNTLQKVLNQVCQQIFHHPVSSSNLSQGNPESIQLTGEVTPANNTEPVAKPTIIVPPNNKPNPISQSSTSSAGKLLNIDNEKHFVGDQPDININNPEQLKKIFYSPSKCFQHIVEQACLQSRQNTQIIQVNVFNQEFYFDYQEQTVYSTVGPAIIRPLCLLNPDSRLRYTQRKSSFRKELHKITQTNKNNTQKKNRDKHSWNMTSFIWLISLWSSRGRIPDGTEILKPVFLIQWPNLTRLASIPHSVRMAALLYDKPYPLADAARVLGIEQRYVFAFYSACHAIGLANISRRQVDQLFAPEQIKDNKDKSILSKILYQLKQFSDTRN